MLLVRRTRAVVAYRRILWLLIVRDLKIRYANSALGYVWSVLDPLLMTGVYWFVFVEVFHRKGRGESPYIVFLVLGLLSWNWFASTITDCTRALVQDNRLVRSTNIPREIWVIKTVGSKALEYLFSIPVIIIFMIAYKAAPTRLTFFFVIAFVLEFILLTGVGLALAAMTVMVRDLQRIVRIGLRIGFYGSTVIYGLASVPGENARRLISLNPMTGIIAMSRMVVFDKDLPSWHVYALSTGISLVTLVVGLQIFKRLEPVVLKEI